MIATAVVASRHIRGLSYYKDFISKQQKQLITQLIDSHSWCTRLRRHQQYYGLKYFQTKHDDNVLQNKQSTENQSHYPLEEFQWLIDRMTKQIPVFDMNDPPNQCLVNKYLKHDVLGMHVEDKLCYGRIIAGISLGTMDYLRLNHETDQERKFYVELEDCSLYVLKDQAREQFRHGIGRAIDGKGYKDAEFQRISLTFRHVIQTRRKLQ